MWPHSTLAESFMPPYVPVLDAAAWYIPVVSTLVLVILALWAVRLRRLPLPPGPKGNVFFGITRSLPRSHLFQTYREWSIAYKSPIIHFRSIRNHTIVLNTYRAAVDLLESRAIIYSDRPRRYMPNVLGGRGLSVFEISSEHPRFKAYRKLMHSGLNPRKVSQYSSLMERERDMLLENLRAAPDGFVTHFRRNSGSLMLSVTYGWTITTIPDRFISLLDDAIAITSQLIQPGRWMVDIFPLLRFVPSWFPGAEFKRFASKAYVRLRQIDEAPFNWAKEQLQCGTLADCFVSQHLTSDDEQALDDEAQDILMWCSAAMYLGGSDTTLSHLTTFMLYMMLYPRTQHKAREELETVIGKERLPTCADAKKLPYIHALLKEVLRIAPVAPLALPHRVTREDEYAGYRIPAGSTVIANIWEMTHDPELYPDPMVFEPERHLALNGSRAQFDPRKIVFGFGRRVCPGMHVAEASLFINMTSILLTFDILKPLDELGQPVDPPTEYTGGVISHPKPFKCCLRPRTQ